LLTHKSGSSLESEVERKHNARLRGWQRIRLNSNTTTETTAAQWDWKRHALTVPLEAFVMAQFSS
ncbi:hypothetical protein, partial [Vibrio cholerae]|uniref:hypothetical protein n=1 Tax=Vibrio cholerae TaxID=666 RepID=UPI00293470FC